jgi:hypothetical protein
MCEGTEIDGICFSAGQSRPQDWPFLCCDAACRKFVEFCERKEGGTSDMADFGETRRRPQVVLGKEVGKVLKVGNG